MRDAHLAAGAGRGAVASACSCASSAAPKARLKTATPPIQPVKPTPRELWMTRPMVNGPPTGRKRLVRDAHLAAGAGRGAVASACSCASSAAPKARLKTATPPIQPVKPTPRELWMTRPMVNGPPVPSAFGV